jgi:hypothetical protein
MNMIFLHRYIMTESIAPPDTNAFGDHERPKRIFKIIVIGDSHVGRIFENISIEN